MPTKNQAFTLPIYDGTTGRTITTTISKDGGAFASAGVVTELSGGWYNVALSATDMNADVIAIVAVAAGMIQINVVIDTESVAVDVGTVEVATGWSRDRIARKLAALAVSKTSGNTQAGGTIVFRTLDDSGNEFSATLDADGNRTAVTQGS